MENGTETELGRLLTEAKRIVTRDWLHLIEYEYLISGTLDVLVDALSCDIM